jgi:gamma-glutamyltranspeptidase/glutathione hydrolase
MVATAHPEATKVGIEILRQGGNAIDAAIAANAALGVIEPHMCGVGGDLMAIVWLKDGVLGLMSEKFTGRPRPLDFSGEVAAFNGSGRSPLALSLDVFRERDLDRIPVRHPLTWTVPGCIQAWEDLNSLIPGSLPWDALFQPAIRLAEEGCRVPPIIAQAWANAPSEGGESFRHTFLPGGHAPRTGEIFRNPDLAETYRRIARDPSDFYSGEIAERIVEYSKAHGGLLSEDDLNAHEPFFMGDDPAFVRDYTRDAPPVTEEVEAELERLRKKVEDRRPMRIDDSQGSALLTTNYRGTRVLALPPNTQGMCVIQMLQMLEKEDLASLGHGSVETLHRMIVAKKLSFEDRGRHIADPTHVDVPTERMLSAEHAARRWKRFDPKRAMNSIPDDLPMGPDTTYLCAADEEGNAISLIQSVYWGFGSGHVPDGLGFCLQNRGLGFSLDPDHPCCVGPFKRPLHTIIPGFALRDGKPWLCFGVMGGNMQPQGQVQILTNMLDFGMDVQTAGEAPRWRHEGSTDVDGTVMTDGGEVFLEEGTGESTRMGLAKLGHRISNAPQVFGGYQAIEFDHERGVLRGGSDPRKDGCAMGL